METIFQIEKKQDSPEKMAEVFGKEKKYILFAEDYNVLVNELIKLHKRVEKLELCCKCNDNQFSSGSSNGTNGIGGDLIDAWANAKLFPIQIDNQFVCGGTFGVAKLLNFNGALNLFLPYSDISSSSGALIELFDLDNSLVQTFSSGLYFGNNVLQSSGQDISESIISKIIISASSYSTSNNSMCSNGSITLTP